VALPDAPDPVIALYWLVKSGVTVSLVWEYDQPSQNPPL
jgi:hypothetical protein